MSEEPVYDAAAPTFFGLKLAGVPGDLSIHERPPEWGERVYCCIVAVRHTASCKATLVLSSGVSLQFFGKDEAAAAHALEVGVLKLRQELDWVLAGTPLGKRFSALSIYDVEDVP